MVQQTVLRGIQGGIEWVQFVDPLLLLLKLLRGGQGILREADALEVFFFFFFFERQMVLIGTHVSSFLDGGVNSQMTRPVVNWCGVGIEEGDLTLFCSEVVDGGTSLGVHLDKQIFRSRVSSLVEYCQDMDFS